MPGPPARLLLDEVPPVLRAHLPEHAVLTAARHGRSASVVFVARPDGGPDDTLVLKHASEAAYVTWLRAEAEVLQALADSPLPVPRVLGVHGDDAEAWLLLSRLPGDPLVEVLDATPEAERPGWFRELGRLLAAIHTTPVPACLRSRNSTPWWQRPRPPVDPASSDHILSTTRLHGADTPPAVFVHGDFTLDNVLGRDGHLSGVVDWGGAGRGDPRYDVALALTSSAEGRVRLPSAPCVAAFYEGYLETVTDAELYAYFSASRP